MTFCKKIDIKDCPYRETDGDTFNHWIRSGLGPDKAEKRAGKICVSIPCLYNIEKLLEALHFS